MRKLFITIMVILSLVIFAQEASKTLVAEVNGRPVTQEELDREANLNRLLLQLQSIDERFYEVLTTTPEGLALIQRYKKEVLNNLIDQILIVQIGEKMNVSVSKDTIEKMVSDELNKTLSQYNMTESDLDWYLKTANLGDLETFKNRLRWIFKVQQTLQQIQQKVTANATVTEEEVKKFYEENKEFFAVEESAKLLRIIVETQEQANKVLERLRTGEDFSKIASEVSIDPLTKGKAGDLGWVERYSGLLAQEVEEKIFASPVGAILGPMKTSGGWEIYRILEKRPKGYQSLEEVSTDIRNYLSQSKANELWQRWIQEEFLKFKQTSDIKIYLLTEQQGGTQQQ
ncbi:peptidyl-prolyl cis-trans isomerase [Pseudothermotoga sp.]|uniref:peptidyl-prolyl cis-trans isomerase n=1 Tax=Pseudothermotoga sp. TaxID=2033661 RepID=UPI0031F668BF